VRQVGRRVLAQLSGSFSTAPDGPLVLCAREIGAADLLERGDMVVAAVSMLGGPNGHASIIARSLGIPLLLGVDLGLLDVPDGTEILVDTARSRATVHPAVAERADAIIAMNDARRRREALALERDLPCRTLDGQPIGLRANVATVAETRAASAYNAGGVGLLRTEIPFLDAYGWPTQFQHEAVLTPIISKLTGEPVTVRTLDFADDKLPPFLADRREGGRLGRGLALMLAEPAAFVQQFRAILSVGMDVDLRIMVPMVADVAELRSCKKILAECAAELGVPLPPLGAMIELPEAVSAADELAREAAFFSIGSNDLTSRILDLDRRDPALTPALAAHPRVLRAIAHTVDAAHRHGREVSVCGDAAAHPVVIPLLIGLNVDALSVAPAALDEVRARVRRLNWDLCAEAAWKAQRCHFFDDVMQIVGERCSPEVP
jgi:phosphoenolpyruvate-protein kinase (PTS system EI component)